MRECARSVSRAAVGGSRIVGVDLARGTRGDGHVHRSPRPLGLAGDDRGRTVLGALRHPRRRLARTDQRGTCADRAASVSRAAVRASVPPRAVPCARSLIALGLLLRTLDSGIAVILDSYGAFYVVLVPLLFLRRSGLAAVAFALAALAATVLPGAPEQHSRGGGWRSAALPAVRLVLHRLLPGGALDRLPAHRADRRAQRPHPSQHPAGPDRRRRRRIDDRLRGAALLGTDAHAHSDTVWEMLGSGGLAVLVIGGLTLMTSAPRVGPVARAVGRPIGAVGAMPLTIYTVQVGDPGGIPAGLGRCWRRRGETRPAHRTDGRCDRVRNPVATVRRTRPVGAPRLSRHHDDSALTGLRSSGVAPTSPWCPAHP